MSFRESVDTWRPSDEICIDIVCIAVPVGADRCDDGDKVFLLQPHQDVGVDVLHFTYEPEILVGISIGVGAEAGRPGLGRQGLRKN